MSIDPLAPHFVDPKVSQPGASQPGASQPGKSKVNLLDSSPGDSPLLHSRERLVSTVRDVVEQTQGDIQGLLLLLRVLEQLHREIRDGAFREALPGNRQALYGLLREMETVGGWPYIPRMDLRTLLRYFENSDPSDLTGGDLAGSDRPDDRPN